MRACWLKWVGRDWSISADYIWLKKSDANRGKLEKLVGDLVNESDVARANVIKRSLNLRKRDLISDILKPQTTAECNQLSAISIDAEDSAGINSFNNFHVSPPKQNKAPEAEPDNQCQQMLLQEPCLNITLRTSLSELVLMTSNKHF